MKALYTILLLIVSNVFMTFAWYGHLKMKQEYLGLLVYFIDQVDDSLAIAFVEVMNKNLTGILITFLNIIFSRLMTLQFL